MRFAVIFRTQNSKKQNCQTTACDPETVGTSSGMAPSSTTPRTSTASKGGTQETRMNQERRSSRTSGHFNDPVAGGSSTSGTNATTTDNSERHECRLCLLQLPSEFFPVLSTCNHRTCYDCFQAYLRIEISESRVMLACPQCSELLHPSDIRMILNDEQMLAKYETFMLRRILVAEPDARWCPAPDCNYAVIATGCASCPKLQCLRPGCGTNFCYHCKQEWHPNQACDQAARSHQRPPIFSARSPGRRGKSRSTPDSISPFPADLPFPGRSKRESGDDIKPCPCCKVLIIKMDDGSCNHMTCSVCGAEFCWLCMKVISDLHYLSPSGCTFWGKKPWSRKKKILWQLGMLVGAPVGIALIAGIAVPAIIIGIPVWVGKKLHARFERKRLAGARRNLVVASGVLASIFVSPVLAAVAVGIGVPILLAYVYGVVPISLCRSGGCGVSASASGVRIDIDEENEIGFTPYPAGDGASISTAHSNKWGNPSIGDVSFGMSASLSMGSGYHLDPNNDRASDRESASNAALAGSICSSAANETQSGQAAATLASSTGRTSHSQIQNSNHQQHSHASKLEVRADVASSSSDKRLSISSRNSMETASGCCVSLTGSDSTSCKTGNTQDPDIVCGSTDALAGSITMGGPIVYGGLSGDRTHDKEHDADKISIKSVRDADGDQFSPQPPRARTSIHSIDTSNHHSKTIVHL